MNWNDILLALITAVFGAGGVGALFNYKLNKGTKKAEGEVKLAEGWKSLSEEKSARIVKLEATLDKRNEKIDELYRENTALRKKLDNVTSQNAVLSVYKCTEIGCPKRQPPFGKFTIPEIVDDVKVK